MTIVVCPAGATVQMIGFNLDQKRCTAPTIGQVRLYYLFIIYVALSAFSWTNSALKQTGQLTGHNYYLIFIRSYGSK